MIDFARITVRAGDGGRGAGSFTHIKGKRRGKADGGDGGRGGNVYLVATSDLNTLEPFRYLKDYKAKDGASGLSRRRKGADGENLVIKVPVGTLISLQSIDHRLPTEAVDSRQWTVDLAREGQRILVALGGQGGRGNMHLRDDFGRRPKTGELGQPGEVGELTLELKLIADVGLIGLPNSGKSTLLSALTAAKPAIAPYPFTTLEPNLGVLNSSLFTVVSSQKEKKKKTVNREPSTTNRPASLVLADIPGLIEGASKGKGLGDLFLRHIERTRMLVHLIDISTDSDKWRDYQTIRKELRQYSGELVTKKEIIVLTKIDLVAKSKIKSYLELFGSKKKKVRAISAKTGEGLGELAKEMIDFRL